MLERYSKIVVTGGCGFIGRHLVSDLISRNKEVLIVDDLSTSYDKTTPKGATLILSDICNADGLAQKIADSEIIFHLAGNSNGTVSVENREFDYKVNAIGTKNVLRIGQQIGVKRFIYLSSASIYGKPSAFPIHESHPASPFLPYGGSKLEGELSCKKSRLPIVIARPFCVYGSDENPKTSLVEVTRYLRWHLNYQPIQIVGNSNSKTRDFVHVRDVVSALILLADADVSGEAFNIGTGREVSMSQLVSMIMAVSGRKARIREISDILDDSYRLVPDISRLSALGYMPRISLEDGVKELVQSLGERPELPNGMTIFHKGQIAESKY
jgi:nucleoside-diphosphate-sugar epimerase